jgi:hypothetical protein
MVDWMLWMDDAVKTSTIQAILVHKVRIFLRQDLGIWNLTSAIAEALNNLKPGKREKMT